MELRIIRLFPTIFYIVTQKYSINPSYTFLTYRVTEAHFSTIVNLYQKHHPVDSRITDRKVLVDITLQTEIQRKDKVKI